MRAGDNLDPDKIWATLMSNEKPGGHGERSVAVGTIDMAVWDAVAKIAGKPLFRLLAERHGRNANPRVFVYAAGGYYYPGKGLSMLRGEMRGYLDRAGTAISLALMVLLILRIDISSVYPSRSLTDFPVTVGGRLETRVYNHD